MRVSLIDANDGVVMDRHQELAVTQFTKTRAANLVVPVPIERLAAGEYLLTLRAELNGTAVRRDTRLRVR